MCPFCHQKPVFQEPSGKRHPYCGRACGAKVSLIPLRYRLFTPELQWQPRVNGVSHRSGRPPPRRYVNRSYRASVYVSYREECVYEDVCVYEECVYEDVCAYEGMRSVCMRISYRAAGRRPNRRDGRTASRRAEAVGLVGGSGEVTVLSAATTATTGGWGAACAAVYGTGVRIRWCCARTFVTASCTADCSPCLGLGGASYAGGGGAYYGGTCTLEPTPARYMRHLPLDCASNPWIATVIQG